VEQHAESILWRRLVRVHLCWVPTTSRPYHSCRHHQPSQRLGQAERSTFQFALPRQSDCETHPRIRQRQAAEVQLLRLTRSVLSRFSCSTFQRFPFRFSGHQQTVPDLTTSCANFQTKTWKDDGDLAEVARLSPRPRLRSCWRQVRARRRQQLLRGPTVIVHHLLATPRIAGWRCGHVPATRPIPNTRPGESNGGECLRLQRVVLVGDPHVRSSVFLSNT